MGMNRAASTGQVWAARLRIREQGSVCWAGIGGLFAHAQTGPLIVASGAWLFAHAYDAGACCMHERGQCMWPPSHVRVHAYLEAALLPSRL